ncbi:MAG: hypothetical protein VW268_03585 [Rhodospirillaceae bacterium]
MNDISPRAQGNDTRLAERCAAVSADLERFGLPSEEAQRRVAETYIPIAREITSLFGAADAPKLLVLLGGPGASKSTFSKHLKLIFQGASDMTCAVVSSDDF